MNGESAKEVNFYHIVLLVCLCNNCTYVLEQIFSLPVAMESSSPRKEPNCILLLPWKISSGGKLVPVSIHFATEGRVRGPLSDPSDSCLCRSCSRGVVLCRWKKNA